MSTDSIANTFRRWGHLQAKVDPFSRLQPFPHRELDEINAADAKKWREIYCSTIGAEFMHMPFPDRCDWLASRLEGKRTQLDQRFILKRILSAETLEKFIHTRYVGAKRFSLEGLAVMVPLLDGILDQAASHGFETIMIAMSHRGRINVMHHIAQTSADKIFAGFEDIDPRSALGSDDVKYHKGATGIYKTASGKEVYVDLSSNPSHLEAINPVLMGRVRARQERLQDRDTSKVLGIILHGDAAFAGQGVAAESLNFADLPGFRIGGVVHVVVNNMIGFTATPPALYSSRYSTDIAKRLNIPIFHVNAECPDSVLQIAKIATDYRKTFYSDVVIDLVGYRRFGHSEIDDPTLTSPTLYRDIKDRPLLWQTYAEKIGIAQEDIDQLQETALSVLEDGLARGRSMTKKPVLEDAQNYWEPFYGGLFKPEFEVETKVPNQRLEEIAQAVTAMPAGFNIHPKLKKGFEQRLEMGLGKRPIDWGMAETLAFGSLLQEQVPVRITGQDSRRGTFSHRQAVLYDYETGNEHIPLMSLGQDQARFDVYDSMLSEAAAVGFEYGFSRDYPESLVCWDAQFGDFVNGAQIIIDQFISAGEDKWSMLSGLVMLLPHGFEGQGPEHSHARLERFIQLCGEDNMIVCYPSTSGQYFHLLRRQALRKWRKPLIVMTPKSMLRAPAACSPREKLSEGSFQNVINDKPEFFNADRLLFCSGKIAHELRAARKKKNDANTAIICVEQLYPLPEEELKQALASYPNIKSVHWVQEEPANMGALFYIRRHLERLAPVSKVSKISRSASASPATGSPKAHSLEQEAIINMAFQRY